MFMLKPEFATCGCKMEPFAAPFFQHLCDLLSVYAVFRVLRKYTYIYDLHENFDLSFDVFYFCTPVQFCRNPDSKSIKYPL